MQFNENAADYTVNFMLDIFSIMYINEKFNINEIYTNEKFHNKHFFLY